MEYVVAVIVGLGLSQLAGLITTVYLHRVLAHKAIRLHPALTMFMRIGTWMFTIVSPREWVAVHRKHHNFSDVEGDPHSPHIEGYWKIMIANVYYYKREARNDDTLEKYAADLPHDRIASSFFRIREMGFVFTGALLVLCGSRPGTRGAHRAHGRVHILNARSTRRGHLRLSELRERRDEPQAPRVVTFGRACTTTTTPRRRAKLSAFRGELDPRGPHPPFRKARVAKVLTTGDEGWENHRRRIHTTTEPPRTSSVEAVAKD